MTAVRAATDPSAYLRTRKNTVDFLDIPELGFAVVDGRGEPASAGFQAAIQALYSVSYGAHFAVRKARGEAPKVQPLEALWWFEGVTDAQLMELMAGGQVPTGIGSDDWRWRAMIAQADPISADDIAAAAEASRAKSAELPEVRYERWTQGSCAQILHVGPYSAEGPTNARLYQAIRDAGMTPVGPHHEIYLGDPRRSAPERLRTLLRHGVAPA